MKVIYPLFSQKSRQCGPQKDWTYKLERTCRDSFLISLSSIISEGVFGNLTIDCGLSDKSSISSAKRELTQK